MNRYSATILTALSWLVLLPYAPLPGQHLDWEALPPLPDELGVAGPMVGVHNDVLIVAGGANFPLPVWENEKQWLSDIYGLRRVEGGYRWTRAGQLDQKVAYGACVSTPQGIVCIGGNDGQSTLSDCFLLRWDDQSQTVRQQALVNLPTPLAYAQACLIGETIYVAGGQTAASLDSAIDRIWFIDLEQLTGDDASSNQARWQPMDPWPGPPRAFHIAVSQNNGFDDCLYIIGGRYQENDQVHFLSDCWEFNPKTRGWRERNGPPQALTAGTGISFGQSHILVLSGDDGALFDQTDALRDSHPGFPRETFAYHTITDTWTECGESPANQVTTSAVYFDDSIVLPTGEIRPRVRTPKVWRITLPGRPSSFETQDYVVLILYLASLVGIGFHFSRKTLSTEDYFRASGKIPWWAAGCSIFATMLSSLTFTGVPSKAFAQDWVYALGNFMIPVVSILAVFVALPFYRSIDVTSAYEYLEKRFTRSIRLFGSTCFSVFHVFRMAIVMSLTGLALAVATPLEPMHAVLIMGSLSMLYCSLGGVSAVIWTDTLQTIVLLGGALVAIAWMLTGTGESLQQSLSTAMQSGKLNMANWHLSPSDAQIALWVVVVGALAQNTSSYTADQAVVQRYMTTGSPRLAAQSIWTNAVLTVPATILFFGIGTSLFLFYRAHPERLDPTISTDQIFPLFIAQELPAGLSGLIVAAIFAAAQSTVSTSMNSVATVLVTDFVRPLGRPISERGFLRLAQMLTVLLGIMGTVLALLFISPDIRSLFDQFIKVIGLFMGVLGGLFILGVLVPRANATGAWVGAIVGATVMLLTWQLTPINGYLYTAIGIVVCVVTGALGSFFAPPPQLPSGLTLSALPSK